MRNISSPLPMNGEKQARRYNVGPRRHQSRGHQFASPSKSLRKKYMGYNEKDRYIVKRIIANQIFVVIVPPQFDDLLFFFLSTKRRIMKRVLLIVLGIALLLSAGSAIWVFASDRFIDTK